MIILRCFLKFNAQLQNLMIFLLYLTLTNMTTTEYGWLDLENGPSKLKYTSANLFRKNINRIYKTCEYQLVHKIINREYSFYLITSPYNTYMQRYICKSSMNYV